MAIMGNHLPIQALCNTTKPLLLYLQSVCWIGLTILTMQRCVYTINSDRCQSPKELCTKIALAMPSPTPIRKRLQLVQIINLDSMSINQRKPNLFPVLKPFSMYDGYVATNKIKPKHWNTLKLLEYLHITKNLYHLSDCDALQLLGFFKNNFDEACRHLCCGRNKSHMVLDFDSPWRIGTKTISQLPNMEQFTTHTFFKNFHQLFIINSNILTNVLPQQSMAEQYQNRYVRIQRCFNNDQIIWAACVLPTKKSPIEVAALLLPSADKKELNRCTKLMDELEQYIEPLILASKSWTVLEQKSKKAEILIKVLSTWSAAMEGLFNDELLKQKLPRDAVTALLNTYEILY